MAYKLQHRLYYTADEAELVKAGDERAATLFGPAGKVIPDSVAEKYGLGGENSPDEPENNEPSINASKAALELATEKGIDLSTVEGTGSDGKITVGDVRALIAE